MKSLKTIILEKLTITSNSKIKSVNISNQILKYWGLDPEDKDINDIIDQWAEDNDVNEVIPIAHPETLNDASELIPDNIIKQYKSDMKSIEDCEHELDKAKNIYHYGERGENIDIMCTDNMIAILGWYGTLYCVKK